MLRTRILTTFLLLAALASPAAAGDGWFPKINGRGEIASGFGTVEFQGRAIEPGVLPQFIDDDTLVYNGNDRTVIYNVRTGARTTVARPYNFYAAGGGMWLGMYAGEDYPTQRFVGATMLSSHPNAGTPTVAPTSGSWGYVEPYHAQIKNLWVSGQKVVSEAWLMGADLTDQALVYQLATGTYTRITMVKRNGAAAVDSSITNWEAPTGCDGPDDVYVLSVTQAGLALRKAGATRGWYWPGEQFNPSCRFVGGQFIVAFSSARGELGVRRFASTDATHLVNYADIVRAGDCVPGMTPFGPCPSTPPVPPVVIPPVIVPPVVVPPVAQFAYDLGPLNTFAQRRWRELLPPEDRAARIGRRSVVARLALRERQADAFFRILWEFRQAGHPEIELYQKGFGGTNYKGFAEDILVLALPNGKWWSDVGPSFGSTVASLSFVASGFQITSEPDKCVAPPRPDDVVLPPPVDPIPDPAIAALKARIAVFDAMVRALEADVATLHSSLGQLQVERDDARQERDRVRVELDALKARPEPRCEAKVPAWIRSLGVKVGCQIVQ